MIKPNTTIIELNAIKASPVIILFPSFYECIKKPVNN